VTGQASGKTGSTYGNACYARIIWRIRAGAWASVDQPIAQSRTRGVPLDARAACLRYLDTAVITIGMESHTTGENLSLDWRKSAQV